MKPGRETELAACLWGSVMALVFAGGLAFAGVALGKPGVLAMALFECGVAWLFAELGERIARKGGR